MYLSRVNQSIPIILPWLESGSLNRSLAGQVGKVDTFKSGGHILQSNSEQDVHFAQESLHPAIKLPVDYNSEAMAGRAPNGDS